MALGGIELEFHWRVPFIQIQPDLELFAHPRLGTAS
jgi:hypothetical protein